MEPTSSVLIIDDDLDDIEIFNDALKQIDDNIICLSAFDAMRGLAMLVSMNTMPSFIFLDLNMPKMNGKKCLAELRKMSALASVPIIIYTTSKIKDDIAEMERLGASCFLIKPIQFSSLKQSIRRILKQDWSKRELDFVITPE